MENSPSPATHFACSEKKPRKSKNGPIFNGKEIRVSDHARERMITRMGCSPKKVDSIALKAWKSTDEIPAKLFQKVTKNFEENLLWRRLMGWSFIFAPKEDRIVLLTVFGRKGI